MLIEELASNSSGKIDIIPTTAEDYISFTKTFKKNHLFDTEEESEKYDYKECIKFRFIDSFRFLPASLEKLASNLSTNDLEITKQIWANLDSDKFDMIKRKGVYPYDYVDSPERLLEMSLPPIEAFYNQLNETNITEAEYNFAESVWNAFELETMQEYTDLYLKTDVLLLADIFENFRDTSMKSYGLDPAHYYTLPGYSWDAMLKMTKAKIELVCGENIEQINFLEQGKYTFSEYFIANN